LAQSELPFSRGARVEEAFSPETYLRRSREVRSIVLFIDGVNLGADATTNKSLPAWEAGTCPAAAGLVGTNAAMTGLRRSVPLAVAARPFRWLARNDEIV